MNLRVLNVFALTIAVLTLTPREISFYLLCTVAVVKEKKNRTVQEIFNISGALMVESRMSGFVLYC